MTTQFSAAPCQVTVIDELVLRLRDALLAEQQRLRSGAPRPAVPLRVALKAPTGSGKTSMAIAALRRLCEDPDLDLAVIWIAPNELHEQSRRTAERLSQGVFSAVLSNAVGRTLDHNEFWFINWMSLNKGTTNSIRRVNERGEYLSALIAGAEREGRLVVVVIDESHRDAEAKGAQDALGEIHPAVEFHMSATIGDADAVVLPRELAVRDGLIRTSAMANEELDKAGPNADLLTLALAKRDELAAAYKKRGRRVNPLLVIQVSNAMAGRDQINAIRRQLAERGIVEDPAHDGRLAISMSDRHTFEDSRDPRIVDNEGIIEVLIVKQSIATGWDCPRAQVLYKVRAASDTDTFDIQTLGRVLRCAEPGLRKPYGDPLLDRAYCYHTDRNYKGDEDFGIQTASATLRPNIVSPTLAGGFVAPVSGHLPVEALRDLAWAVLRDDLRLGQPDSLIDMTLLAMSETLANQEIREGAAPTVGDTVRLRRDPASIQFRFTSMTDRWAGYPEGSASMRADIYRAFEDLSGTPTQSEIQRIVVADQNALRIEDAMLPRLKAALSVHRLDQRERVEPLAWTLAGSRGYNTKSTVAGAALYEQIRDSRGIYAYEPCFLRADRLKPEQGVEEDLRGSAAVAWWVKNGETAGVDFSIPYETEDGVWRTFFPDYIVGFTDGSIGVFEAKDPSAFTTSGDAAVNRAKAETLANWAAKNGCEAGFLLIDASASRFYARPNSPVRLADDVFSAHRSLAG